MQPPTSARGACHDTGAVQGTLWPPLVQQWGQRTIACHVRRCQAGAAWRPCQSSTCCRLLHAWHGTSSQPLDAAGAQHGNVTILWADLGCTVPVAAPLRAASRCRAARALKSRPGLPGTSLARHLPPSARLNSSVRGVSTCLRVAACPAAMLYAYTYTIDRGIIF